jgi:histidinol-phosphate aminotransferase
MKAFNLNEIIRPNIQKLQAYSSARDEYKGIAEVYLDANENPFGTLNRYPDPKQAEVKKKLATLKNVDSNQIFIGNGSDEVIDLAFRIFCTPGKDKALTFTPSYGMYTVSASINDISLIELPLNSNFQIDIESLQPYFSDENLKLLFLCSPNNPTGNCFEKETIQYILNNFNGIVIIDEAYMDFSTKESYVSSIESYPNLIVSQTFSKAWGLAAARVGVAYANTSIINWYNKVKPPYNISSLNQDAIIKALHNVTLFEENKKIILEEREKLISQLQSIPIVKKIYPTEANFVLIEVEDADSTYTKLVAQKTIVRNRNKLINNTIRITIGSNKENQQLIKGLQNL